MCVRMSPKLSTGGNRVRHQQRSMGGPRTGTVRRSEYGKRGGGRHGGRAARQCRVAPEDSFMNCSPERPPVWCEDGRWGPRRVRVSECWGTILAEDVYTALVDDDPTV